MKQEKDLDGCYTTMPQQLLRTSWVVHIRNKRLNGNLIKYFDQDQAGGSLSQPEVASSIAMWIPFKTGRKAGHPTLMASVM